MKKRVLVLGATGSIGKSALDIIEQRPDLFELVGLTANNSKDALEKSAAKFNCKNTCVSNGKTETLVSFIKNTDADIAVNGIAGAAGLLPSVACLESRKNLALANKETMVMAGHLVKSLAKKNSLDILPVDSEHSAVFMLIGRNGKQSLDKIILTASGGPFRNYNSEQLKSVKLEDALKHPTWNMGQKITIDSATLANKGLEVIEAVQLFDVPVSKVQVVVHPQSIVHSLIRTVDGVMYAQLSKPDMRHPIVTALTYPEYVTNNLEQLDFLSFGKEGATLSFYPPRTEDFPMLKLAYKAAESGNKYNIAYNAANEVAVAEFVAKRIGFLDIASIVQTVLESDWQGVCGSIDEVFDTDFKARQIAKQVVSCAAFNKKSGDTGENR